MRTTYEITVSLLKCARCDKHSCDCNFLRREDGKQISLLKCGKCTRDGQKCMVNGVDVRLDKTGAEYGTTDTTTITEQPTTINHIRFDSTPTSTRFDATLTQPFKEQVLSIINDPNTSAHLAMLAAAFLEEYEDEHGA
jgi:hypothetical protein